MSTQSKGICILAYIVFPSALFPFVPSSVFERMNVGWLFGLVIALPVSIVAGLLSCCSYYGRHDLVSVDPFYVRAWWTMVGGAVTCPLCLLFRPAVAGIAFDVVTFGAGSVVAFHIYQRYAKRNQT